MKRILYFVILICSIFPQFVYSQITTNELPISVQRGRSVITSDNSQDVIMLQTPDMTWQDECQVVFFVRNESHVIHGSCAAAQTKGQDDVRKDEVFVKIEESLHLTHNQNARLLDGVYQILFFNYHLSFCFELYDYLSPITHFVCKYTVF